MREPEGRSVTRALAALVVPLMMAAAAPAARAQEPTREERGAVLEAVEGILEAINAPDPGLARAWTTADVRLQGTPGAADAALGPSMDQDGFVGMLTSPGEDFDERIWDPEVRVQGRIAQVWAPYDLYRDGSFSHCGIDAFTLVRTSEGWRVTSVVWTVQQPPACSTHPEGPPGG